MLKSCETACQFETQLDLRCLSAQVLPEDDYFATVPMSVVQPASVRESASEEDLYTLFEEAISARVAVVSRQLSHLSPPEGDVCTAMQGCCASTARRRTCFSAVVARFRRFWQTRRPALTLLCLGLNLLLLGFDCMGVLVLAR